MRRFNLPKRIKRCRNLCGTADSGHGGAVGNLCRPELPPEECEVTFAPGISATQRAYVLDHDGLFCGMCGVAPGDIDDFTGIKAKFHIGLIRDINIGGKDELSNLRTLCSTCYQGAKNITSEKPTALWLLSQVRRAGQDEQLAVLRWLRLKFKV